jgi:hypothetical protein
MTELCGTSQPGANSSHSFKSSPIKLLSNGHFLINLSLAARRIAPSGVAKFIREMAAISMRAEFE